MEEDPGWPRASATSTTPTLEFDHRIEVVFLAEDRAHRGWITRTDPDIGTPAGLWPSDYAGVVLTVKPG